MCMLSCVQLFATPWTVTHQAPLPTGFSRQESWSGLPCHPPGDLPNIDRQILTAEPPGKPLRPFGWPLIQCDLCSYEEEEIGTDRKTPVACWRTEGRPCEDTARRHPPTSQGERSQRKPVLLITDF